MTPKEYEELRKKLGIWTPEMLRAYARLVGARVTNENLTKLIPIRVIKGDKK